MDTEHLLQPSEQLFAIPSTALINVATLAAHYPSSSSLSPTQLISLHLFISRPMNGHDSDDAVFGPFISILPREFDSHPLTWMVRRKVDNSGSPLLELLPPSITSALTALRKRFFKDWDIISKYNVSTQILASRRLIGSRAIKVYQYPGRLWIIFGPG